MKYIIYGNWVFETSNIKSLNADAAQVKLMDKVKVNISLVDIFNTKREALSELKNRLIETLEITNEELKNLEVNND